jgi:hypothetical protein
VFVIKWDERLELLRAREMVLGRVAHVGFEHALRVSSGVGIFGLVRPQSQDPAERKELTPARALMAIAIVVDARELD